MSNSPLVSYTKLSPNHSGERTHCIDRITPHCVVGQASVETLGNIFEKPSGKASCNYGIGEDGRVGMYVEECNRSWCSSSNPNDQRAVTIECASDNEDPYAFNDTVYNKLVELCADICKRNGKDKVIWIEDKKKALKYTPKANEMQFTVHRWFAKKSCPGPWLMERMNDLTEKVNALLAQAQTVVEEQSKVVLEGRNTEEKIWNYLKAWIGNEFAVAGIMGNLRAESNFKTNNLQNSFEQKMGFTDDTYTVAVDEDVYQNFVHDGAGYGLAQWTFWSRKEGLLGEAKKRKVSISDLELQLDYLEFEMSSKKDLMSGLRGAISVRQAAEVVLKQYEKPADQSNAVVDKRTNYGQEIYDRYHKTEAKLYRVQAGAFSIKENADRFANTLKGKGFNAIIKDTVINDKTIYRVQVGAFANRLNADALVVSLRREGVEAIVVV